MTKSKIKIKQIISVILSLLMILCSSYISNAAVISDADANPCYVNISTCTASLSISGIKATCKASVKTSSSMSLKIKMELQKEKSSGYETVETWTSSKTGTYLSVSESRNINILCDYRLKVTYTAGSETVTTYKY